MKSLIFLLPLFLALGVFAEDKPMLKDSVSAFTQFYGETKMIEQPLGQIRMWRKGNIIITHIDNTPEQKTLGITKADKKAFNSREAFEIGNRYCGITKWELLIDDGKNLIYVSPDRSYVMTLNYEYSRLSFDHVTLQYYLMDEAIEKI